LIQPVAGSQELVERVAEAGVFGSQINNQLPQIKGRDAFFVVAIAAATVPKLRLFVLVERSLPMLAGLATAQNSIHRIII